MQHQATQGVITLLRAWAAGDGTILDGLQAIPYEELRRTTRAYVRRERSRRTLQATALINEVFPRLVDIHQVQSRDREHVLTMAAQVPRRIPVNHARVRGYLKRGGGAGALPMDEFEFISSGRSAAAGLDVSTQAVLRDWSMAMAWLQREITGAI
jgi:hypothetical protein